MSNKTRYFFFQTMMEEGKPRLRALPNQKFDDGSPVNTSLNVRAPKEAGKHPGGSRFDYPIGTYFCSTHLELVPKSSGNDFYSVYDETTAAAQGSYDEPEFHPVSDDPAFSFLEENHRNEQMQVAFVAFNAFGDQEVDETPTSKPVKKTNMRKSPVDATGKPRPINSVKSLSYDTQIEDETNLIVVWMRKFLLERNIKSMAVRPKSDEETKKFVETLYSAGEGLTSITSRARFDLICKEQKMDMTGLQNISKGPLRWYLEEILAEHTKCNESTLVHTEVKDTVDDAIFMVTTQMNLVYGMNNTVTSDDYVNLAKALESGWTVDDIVEPDVLTLKVNIADLCKALADGEIPLPAGAAGGTSLLDGIKANKKFEKPKDKDGFHVEELVWNLLVRNLQRKKHTMLIGETGTGKTEIVRMLCERTGTPFTIIPMGAITDPTEQLVGQKDLDPSTMGTRFDWADFALAVQRPGVILLDEINRCPRNGYNILFSVLDGTRTLVASGAKSTDQRVINVNPDCVFFATANIGDLYAGTYDIDEALRNRFIPVELEYLSVKTEKTILTKRTGISDEDAENIALVAANIRKSYNSDTLQHSVSTRETLECASLVADGFPVETAMEIMFLPNFERGKTDRDPNSERGKVRAMIASRFNNCNA